MDGLRFKVIDVKVWELPMEQTDRVSASAGIRELGRAV